MTGFAVLTGFTALVNVFYFRHGRIADLATSPAVWAVMIQCMASLVGAYFRDGRVQIAVALIVGGEWAWYLLSMQGAIAIT